MSSTGNYQTNVPMRLDTIKAWKYRSLNMIGLNSHNDNTLPEPDFDSLLVMTIPDKYFYDNGLHFPGNVILAVTERPHHVFRHVEFLQNK